jgi:hypothetical protein
VRRYVSRMLGWDVRRKREITWSLALFAAKTQAQIDRGKRIMGIFKQARRRAEGGVREKLSDEEHAATSAALAPWRSCASSDGDAA